MTQATSQHSLPGQKPAVWSSPLGHRLMFVLLMLLAFGLYLPTTLLPILLEHCELLAEERRLTQVVARLEEELKHRDEMAQAFAQDSVINERLAVLDLHYTNPSEEVVPVLPPDFSASHVSAVEHSPSRSRLGLPDDWPPWSLRAEQWAEDKGLIDLFLDSSIRPILYMMSAGLAVAAFVVFSPRRRRLRIGGQGPLCPPAVD